MTRSELIETMARVLATVEGLRAPFETMHPDVVAEMYDKATAALAAIEARGLCIVPREATHRMLLAAFDAFEIDDPKQYANGSEARAAIWTAMIAATEQAP